MNALILEFDGACSNKSLNPYLFRKAEISFKHAFNCSVSCAEDFLKRRLSSYLPHRCNSST